MSLYISQWLPGWTYAFLSFLSDWRIFCSDESLSVCVRSTQNNCIGEIEGSGGREGGGEGEGERERGDKWDKSMLNSRGAWLGGSLRNWYLLFVDHDDRLSHFRNIVVGTLQPVSSAGDLSGQFYLSFVLFWMIKFRWKIKINLLLSSQYLNFG